MKFSFLLGFLFLNLLAAAQQDSFYLLKADQVFDGENMHKDWVVLVKGNTIEAAGPMNFKLPATTRIIEMKGATLLPGLIEGHSHLFLHPYNEKSWDYQVLHESRAERTLRAGNHAKATLLAGFTTVRDLGTEGAQYDDAGLKQSIEKGIIDGPRMIIASKAIVAKGAYGPKSDNPDLDLPQGAAEVGNREEMEKEVRLQLSKGADVIKIYADHRPVKDGPLVPAFTIDEIKVAVILAGNQGKKVVVHANSREGMQRAISAGVSTIEHGNEGDESIFMQMKEKSIAYCPTLAAAEAIATYSGWRKGLDPLPAVIEQKKKSFSAALKSGVTICMGGDAGVFTHGENAREMELMVEYGMKPLEVLRSATSVNADVFGTNKKIGRIKKGLLADLVAVNGDALTMSNLHHILFLMKNGKIYQQP